MSVSCDRQLKLFSCSEHQIIEWIKENRAQYYDLPPLGPFFGKHFNPHLKEKTKHFILRLQHCQHYAITQY